MRIGILGSGLLGGKLGTILSGVLGQGAEAVDAYLGEKRDFGVGIIELSIGFITLPFDDSLRLVEKSQVHEPEGEA
jgi:phosphosulfolactate synthase (CoM biosynthesis protein A)